MQSGCHAVTPTLCWGPLERELPIDATGGDRLEAARAIASMREEAGRGSSAPERQEKDEEGRREQQP